MKIEKLIEKLRHNNTPSPRKQHSGNQMIQQTIKIKKEKVTSLEQILKSQDESMINAINTCDTQAEKKLKIIGITGSKGKSSVAYMVHEYLKKQGYKSILYSSITIDSPISYTTAHEAVENPLKDESMLLDAIVEATEYEADYLILEVNERAIKRGLTKDIPFDIRVMTNILSTHNTIFFEDYVNIKKTFFKEDDNAAVLILPLLSNDTISLYHEVVNQKTVTFTSEYISHVRDLAKESIDYVVTYHNHVFDSINGINMAIKTKDHRRFHIESNLIMPYSAFNIACVVAILETLEVFDENQFQDVVRNLVIPGRDEVIKAANRTIIISNSVSPQLENLKKYQNRGEVNQIIVVAGTSGLDFVTWEKEHQDSKYLEEKEQSIRFAYNYIKNNCDVVYITTSDSGAANKEGLLAYQASLIKNSIPYITEADRKTAIKKALSSSREGDVIYISGRGNRRVMCDTKDTMKLFLDKDVVHEILRELGW